MNPEFPNLDPDQYRLYQHAQALWQIAAELQILGAYNWDAYDLRYVSAKLRKSVGDPNAFDDFNKMYAPTKGLLNSGISK